MCVSVPWESQFFYSSKEEEITVKMQEENMQY